jgi:hypothetical protein
MKAEELDQKFDDGEEILQYFDLNNINRPGLEVKQVNQSEDVDVVITCHDHLEQADFEETQMAMQKSFKEAGIETREQIIELIRDVKRELFIKRYL